MSKKTATAGMDPDDNKANQKNANKGNFGVNKQNAQAQGNRGKQMNPNQKNSEQKE